MTPDHASNFAAVAWSHLKSLEDAGEPPEQIARQLAAVARSYATDGLTDEAETLREVVRLYRQRWTTKPAASSGGADPLEKSLDFRAQVRRLLRQVARRGQHVVRHAARIGGRLRDAGDIGRNLRRPFRGLVNVAGNLLGRRAPPGWR